jgi:hypothetical protein
LVVCIFDVFELLVSAEAWCNWYLYDINLFLLYRNLKILLICLPIGWMTSIRKIRPGYT